MNDATNWGWVIAAVAVAWNMINTVYTYYASGQSVTKVEIDKLSQKTSAFGDRLTAIERDVSALPTTAQYHKLEISVTKTEGVITAIEKQTAATAESVKRIENFLLNTQQTKTSRR